MVELVPTENGILTMPPLTYELPPAPEEGEPVPEGPPPSGTFTCGKYEIRIADVTEGIDQKLLPDVILELNIVDPEAEAAAALAAKGKKK